MHKDVQNYSAIRNTVGFFTNMNTNFERGAIVIWCYCDITLPWKKVLGTYNRHLYREPLEEEILIG